MFKNKDSSMVLNKKHTTLPCSPKLTFEIKHGLYKTENCSSLSILLRTSGLINFLHVSV